MFEQAELREILEICSSGLGRYAVRGAVALDRVPMTRMAQGVAQKGHLAVVDPIRYPWGMAEESLGGPLLRGLVGEVLVQGKDGPLDGVELMDEEIRRVVLAVKN